MPRATQPGGVRQVPVQFPMGGLSTATGFAGQPPNTTPDALNVMPFDPAAGRGRGGQRAGVSRVQNAIVAASPVQLLMQADLIQAVAPGLSGFVPAGPNLETTLQLGTGAITGFNAANAAAPWASWRDDTLLANAVFHDGSATADPSTGTSNALVASGGFDPLIATPNLPVQLTCGSALGSGKRASAIKRTGTTAPAGAWGPAYAVSVTFDQSIMSGTNNRVYLLTVADGSGGTSTGKLAAGVAVRDFQYLEFLTLADASAPVVATTIDLVAQFNTNFPTAPGGPLTTLAQPVSGGSPSAFSLSLCKSAGASGNSFMAQATVTLGGNSYTWIVGPAGAGFQVMPYVMSTAAQGGVDDSIVVALDSPNGHFQSDFSSITVTQATLTSTMGPGYGRLIQLVEVQGGNLYSGQLGGVGLATGGGGIFNPYLIPSACFGQGLAFLVDGTNTWQLTLSTNTVIAFAAGAGLGTLPAGCRIAVMWRDRLVLANQPGSEQVIYASRQGTYNDWNYGQPDAASAWALNATSISGHVGQPVYAFAPCSDDVALIGCSSSTFKVSGDPAAGGAVTQLSTSIGIFGQRSWALSPKGVMYFVGTGGFYRWHTAMSGMYGEMAFENLSDKKCPQFFQALNRSTSNVFVEWDRDKHGCWIFVAPVDGSPAACLWFDELTESFWPMQFPAGVTPTAVEEIDADAATGVTARCVLLGGADGNLRKIDYAALTDDGAAIPSHVHLGPRPLADDFHQGIISAMELVLCGDLGATPINLAWALQVADSPEGAYDAASMVASGTAIAGGRQPKSLQRARGNSFDLVLSNAVSGSTWAFERAALTVLYGGMNR